MSDVEKDHRDSARYIQIPPQDQEKLANLHLVLRVKTEVGPPPLHLLKKLDTEPKRWDPPVSLRTTSYPQASDLLDKPIPDDQIGVITTPILSEIDKIKRFTLEESRSGKLKKEQDQLLTLLNTRLNELSAEMNQTRLNHFRLYSALDVLSAEIKAQVAGKSLYSEPMHYSPLRLDEMLPYSERVAKDPEARYRMTLAPSADDTDTSL